MVVFRELVIAAFSLIMLLSVTAILRRKKKSWQPLSWLSSCMFSLLHLLGPLASLLLWQPRGERAAVRLPPSPPGRTPILGHLHLLGAMPHQALAELARQHGPSLMWMWLGSVPTIVASTPDAAKLILQTHDREMASRPCSAVSIHLGFNSSGIVSSPPTETWRRMRQLCTTDLLSAKRVLSFRGLRQEGVKELLRAVLAEQGQVMGVRSKLQVWSLDSISRMTVGKRVCEMCPEAMPTEVIGEMLDLAGALNVGDFIPFMAPLDLQGYERRMKRAGQRWSSVLQKLIDLRRWGESHEANDLLDTLLTTPGLTDDNIKGIVSDMFIAGSETTAITIEWALAELLANPTTMRTLQEELESVVGKARLVEEEDIPSLPFLNSVIKETMRLHPPVPFLVPHESLTMCEVSGYSIPPKTRVLVNVWAIGRNPHAWDYPLQFEPNRFLQGGKYNHVGVHGTHFQFLPFGSGRRKCPGLALGLVTLHIMLASLVQAFDWNLPSDVKQVDMTEKFGLSLTKASPLSIIPTPKFNLSSLYQEEAL